ncbi:MAG: carboxypeptidase regulatory-like domain-containing protein [Acidobacteriota bacterium]
MRRCRGFSHFSHWIAAIAMILLLSSPILADVTGTILGTVTDPSGAVVPKATVTLRNPNIGFVRTVQTDATGSFEFLSVPVGDGFVAEVSAPGFQKSVQSEIKLLVNQSYRVEFHLQLGEPTEVVSVSAAPVQVEASSTHLGDVIQDQKMLSLPLNGRSYIDLLGLQAGVVPITSGASRNRQFVSGGLSQGLTSVNGNRESSNSWLVNGGDVQSSTENGASVVPTLDSIQEFRLLSGNFGAEYGRFSGGIVNVVTKSGTNAFHGSVYEFLRNEKLDARNFFSANRKDPATGKELPGTAIGVFRRNQPGGTFGGPILKDRIFFFADYQATREIRGVDSGIRNVPSNLQRAGNFSDVGTTGYRALTGIVQGGAGGHAMNEVLTQRLGYIVTNGEPYWVPGCDTLADARAGMCVFPGQVIPETAWSPAAKGTLKFIPAALGTLGSGRPYYSTSDYKRNLRDDKFALRIDFNNQQTSTWSFYYHFDDASNIDPYGGGTLPGFPSNTPSRAQQMNVSNTRLFSSNMVNEARFNYTRVALRLGNPGIGLGEVSDWGFVKGGLGLIPTAPEVEGVPRIALSGLGVSFGVPNVNWQFNNTYQAAEDFSYIVGKHTLKLGAEFRAYQINMRWRYNMNGNFTFDGSETGNDFADFLLGAPSTVIVASPGDLDARTKYFGLYAQDSYKLRPNLTFNYGLRWEVSQPWSDPVFNRLQTIVPGMQSKRYPDSPTGWVFATDPGIPKTVAPTQYDRFAPRVGIAYSPGFTEGFARALTGGPGKTSIRASFGLYYLAFEQVSNLWQLGNPPFGGYYINPEPVYFEEPFKGRGGHDPGQRFPFVYPPDGSTGFWGQFLPLSGLNGIKTDNVLPYTEQVNLTLQREFHSSTILTVSYVGTLGHHLLTQVNVNPGNRARCLEIRQLLGPANGCGPFGEDRIYDLGNGHMAYGTRPYSVTSGRLLSQGLLDFGDTYYIATLANSSYHALQVSVDKRVGALRLLGAYTWSKAMDTGSGFVDAGLNPYDYRLSKSLSAYDLAHNFVLSYSYDLPFQKMLDAQSGWRHKLLAGWQLSGITRFSTGIPILLFQSGDRSLSGSGTAADVPNYNGQPIQFSDARVTSTHQYFSKDPFSSPALGTLGTANRRFFHGPGLNNWNLSLHKLTRISERTSVELRAEFYNVFNHAQFINPTGNFAAASFGRVTNARDPRIGQVALKINF